MKEFVHLFLITIASLIPIVDPLGSAVVFLSITDGDSLAERRRQAWKSCFYQLIILLAFFCMGTFILNFFSLSLDGIRVAGGFLIGRFGLNLLSAEKKGKSTLEERQEALTKGDVSFSPMAIILLAGPGTLSVVLGMSSLVEHPYWVHYFAIMLGIVVVSVICWLILRYAHHILNVFGISGIDAVTRFLGFILLCIGVQFILDGLVGVMKQNVPAIASLLR